MKNKFYKAILATILCTSVVVPTFTMPVMANGTGIIWESEAPFVTALWGKYSPHDGKLVYRLTYTPNVNTVIYTEDVEEIKAYGYEITGEYTNERGETYYKFKYVGTQEILPMAQTASNGDEIIIIPPTLPDKPKNEEIYEPVYEKWTVSDYTITTETVVEDWAVNDYTIETVYEDLVVNDYTIETVYEDLVVDDFTVIETVYEEPIFSLTENEQVAMVKEEVIAPVYESQFFLDTANCTVGHCSDAKEIIWEEVWTVDEKPEAPEESLKTTIKVPNTDIEIPWHEELLHNPINNSYGAEEGKESIWEWEGQPQVNINLNCKTAVCYQVDLSEDFSFRTENVEWILECGFEITNETVRKDGVVVYSFEYVK